MQYDPMDTVRWMLDDVKSELASETTLGPNGRTKKKTKAQTAAKQIRAATLCELLWNVEGRPGDLDEYAEQRLAA